MARYVLKRGGTLVDRDTGTSVKIKSGSKISDAISKIKDKNSSRSSSSSSRTSSRSSSSSSSSSNSSSKKSRYEIQGDYMVDTQTGNMTKLKDKSTGSYNDAALVLQKEAGELENTSERTKNYANEISKNYTVSNSKIDQNRFSKFGEGYLDTQEQQSVSTEEAIARSTIADSNKQKDQLINEAQRVQKRNEIQGEPKYTKDPRREHAEIVVAQKTAQAQQSSINQDIIQYEKQYANKQLNPREYVEAIESRKEIEKKQNVLENEYKQIDKKVTRYNDTIERVSKNKETNSNRTISVKTESETRVLQPGKKLKWYEKSRVGREAKEFAHNFWRGFNLKPSEELYIENDKFSASDAGMTFGVVGGIAYTYFLPSKVGEKVGGVIGNLAVKYPKVMMAVQKISQSSTFNIATGIVTAKYVYSTKDAGIEEFRNTGNIVKTGSKVIRDIAFAGGLSEGLTESLSMPNRITNEMLKKPNQKYNVQEYWINKQRVTDKLDDIAYTKKVMKGDDFITGTKQKNLNINGGTLSNRRVTKISEPSSYSVGKLSGDDINSVFVRKQGTTSRITDKIINNKKYTLLEQFDDANYNMAILDNKGKIISKNSISKTPTPNPKNLPKAIDQTDNQFSFFSSKKQTNKNLFKNSAQYNEKITSQFRKKEFSFPKSNSKEMDVIGEFALQRKITRKSTTLFDPAVKAQYKVTAKGATRSIEKTYPKKFNFQTKPNKEILEITKYTPDEYSYVVKSPGTQSTLTDIKVDQKLKGTIYPSGKSSINPQTPPKPSSNIRSLLKNKRAQNVQDIFSKRDSKLDEPTINLKPTSNIISNNFQTSKLKYGYGFNTKFPDTKINIPLVSGNIISQTQKKNPISQSQNQNPIQLEQQRFNRISRIQRDTRNIQKINPFQIQQLQLRPIHRHQPLPTL